MLKFRLTNTLIIGTHFDPKKIQKGKFLGLNGSVWTHSVPVIVIPIEDTSYTSKLNVSEWLDTPLLGVRCLDTIDSTGVTAYHDYIQVERVENQNSWHDVLRKSTPIQFELQLFFPGVNFKTWKSVLTTIMGWLLNDLTGSVLPAGSHEKSVEKSVEISRFFEKISRKSVEN